MRGVTRAEWRAQQASYNGVARPNPTGQIRFTARPTTRVNMARAVLLSARLLFMLAVLRRRKRAYTKVRRYLAASYAAGRYGLRNCPIFVNDRLHSAMDFGSAVGC